MLTKRKVRILLVDDSQPVRTAVARLFQAHGYDVLTATQGAEALDLIGRDQPDLIILDVQMPVMNGLQFRRLQLQRPAIADIPVIVSSELTAVEEIFAGYGVQCVRKGDLSALLAAVARIVGDIDSGPDQT